jgi:hypothetical protein
MSAIPEQLHTWGGSTWNGLLRDAFEFIGPVNGQKVLELGFHDGQIACAFASLVACHRPGGLFKSRPRSAETCRDPRRLRTDRLSSLRWQSCCGPRRIRCCVYEKRAVTTDLPVMLPAIRRKLRPGGRFAFIENAYGGPFRQLLRYWTRPPSSYRGVHYFTPASVNLIRMHFRVELVKSTLLRPVYLICGYSGHDNCHAA